MKKLHLVSYLCAFDKRIMTHKNERSSKKIIVTILSATHGNTSNSFQHAKL